MPLRATLQELKHKRLAAGLAALVLLGAAYAAQPLLLGREVPVYAATRAELVQTVVASGRVETPLRVDIGSQVTGVIAPSRCAKARQCGPVGCCSSWRTLKPVRPCNRRALP